MATAANHFDEALEERRPDGDDHEQHLDHAHDDEYTDVEEVEPKKKWRPSPNMIAAGCILVAMVGFFTYNKYFKNGGQQATGYESADVAPLPAEDDGGGMMQRPQPPRAQVTSPAAAPQQPAQTPSAENTSPNPPLAAPAADRTAQAAPPGPAAPISAPPPPQYAQPAATVVEPGVLAAKDAEISQLKEKLAATEKKLTEQESKAAPAKTPAGGSVPVTHSRIAKAAGAPQKLAKATKARGADADGEQVGYRIRQIVPGQGWIENESGKMFVVGVGDKVGSTEVTKIDAENYRIYTTAGVIK